MSLARIHSIASMALHVRSISSICNRRRICKIAQTYTPSPDRVHNVYVYALYLYIVCSAAIYIYCKMITMYDYGAYGMHTHIHVFIIHIHIYANKYMFMHNEITRDDATPYTSIQTIIIIVSSI